MKVPTITLVFGLKGRTRFYDVASREPVVDFEDSLLRRISYPPGSPLFDVVSHYDSNSSVAFPVSEVTPEGTEIYLGVAPYIPLEVEEGLPVRYTTEGQVIYRATPMSSGKIISLPPTQAVEGRFLYVTETRLDSGVLRVLEVYIEHYPGEPMRVYARELVFANPPDRPDLWGMQGYTEYKWGDDLIPHQVVRGFHLGLPEA